jgi:serine/threonine protein phosphatase PrpC
VAEWRAVVSYRGTGLTDVGRRRTINEDAFLCDDDLGLYIVADGMGGHAAGEVASREAVDTVHAMVRREIEALRVMDELDEAASPAFHRPVRVLEGAIQAATYMVFGLAQHDPERQGMGTTISALLLRGGHGIVAQVGDSRVYLVRDGAAMVLTEDHTLVAWQVKQGLITDEEAARSPHRNVITRAVGSREYVQVDTRVVECRPGDTFLLCSDGLHGYLDDEEIPRICDLGAVVATQRFIELANERGGRDNITAVVVETG